MSHEDLRRRAETGIRQPTCTVGGGIDQTAVIGHAPEHRDWKPGDRFYRPLIEPTARIEAFVTIDCGIDLPTYVGRGTWLMKHVHVGHDAYIGHGCELAPHCSVGGGVQIEDNVRVGQGALFKPYVRVGAGARIGMGAVVLRDVPPGEVWVGNPAGPIGMFSLIPRDDLERLRDQWGREASNVVPFPTDAA